MMRPTIDRASAARTSWDVVVIGAGPAGSIAALQAARSGVRTLLVDRKPFPRNKVCGGCLNGRALALLRSLGINDRLARVNAPSLSEFRLHVSRRQLNLSLPDGIAVSRSRLDRVLVEAATDAGADFLPETSAAAEEVDGETRTVTLASTNCNHERTTIGARIVLAADGLGHRCVPAANGLHEVVAAGARIGFGGLANADCLSLKPGVLAMAVGLAGYVGMVRVEDGRINVAAALDPLSIRRSGSPIQAVADILDDAGITPTHWLASVPWQGTRPLTRRTRCLAHRRLFVLGDAAGYIEPFTGEGMAWAVSCAIEAVPLALKGLAEWDDALIREWPLRYHRRVRRRQRFCRIMTALLRHPNAICSAVGILSRMPLLAQPFVRRLNSPSLAR